MLPDWDFDGDEAKRRTFIEWVSAELDRFAFLTEARLLPGDELPDPVDWTEVLNSSRLLRPVGHPPEPTSGINARIWEYALVRYIFARYWPGRKRPINDPASAARIVVARDQRSLQRSHRTPDRLRVHDARAEELARKLVEEWDRGTKTPGRQQAELDIQFLNGLPAHRFAR